MRNVAGARDSSTCGTVKHRHPTRAIKAGTPSSASQALAKRRTCYARSVLRAVRVALFFAAVLAFVLVLGSRGGSARLRRYRNDSHLPVSHRAARVAASSEAHSARSQRDNRSLAMDTAGRVLAYLDLDWRAAHAVAALSRAAFHRDLLARPEGGSTRVDIMTNDSHPRPNARDEADAADDLIDFLPHLYPPLQRRARAAEELGDLLRLGPRVAGTTRANVLHYLVRAGLGQSRQGTACGVDEGSPTSCAPLSARKSVEAPHLSPEGRALLARASPSTRTSPYRMVDAEGPVSDEGRSWWSLSWDNFTLGVRRPAFEGEASGGGGGEEWQSGASTTDVVRPTNFSNLVFHFAGGARFRARRGTAWHGEPQGPLDARSARSLRTQPLAHVVLAAHWDSKMVSNFTFLAAMDSAVAVLQLLRLMRSIAAWSDVATVLRGFYAKADIRATRPGCGGAFADCPAANVRDDLARLLSPLHHALLYRYAFAEAAGAPCARAGVERAESTATEELGRQSDVRAWLDAAEHLPAITIVLFDGEEAFGEWRGEGHTYGSRHLAQRWRATHPSDPATSQAPPRRRSLFDSVDLFALLDLVGPAGTRFLNTMPPQSGIFYHALALLERSARNQALEATLRLSRGLAGMGMNGSDDHSIWTMTAEAEAYEALQREAPSRGPGCAAVPSLWMRYGAPAEMFTLHGVARAVSRQGATRPSAGVVDYRTRRSYTEALRRPAASRSASALTDLLVDLNRRNVFFTREEGRHGPQPAIRVLIEDDQLHWVDTRRVLHLIPVPFPPCWHEACDDGSNIDHGTVVDLDALWLDFVMRLGDFWRFNATQP